MKDMSEKSIEQDPYMKILKYHLATKHNFHRYARSPGYLDGESQPDPFRAYENTRKIKIPLSGADPDVDYKGMYFGAEKAHDLSLKSIGGFLELCLGLSAWKSMSGAQWALRINPSSGNLHPTESHLIIPELEGISSGIYHYSPYLHSLEERAEVPLSLWEQIERFYEGKGFFIALSSIYWRESWKYGERAFRYCNHDIGHALAAIRFAANIFGWKALYLNGLSDEDMEKMLGFNKIKWPELDKEEADLVCWVSPQDLDEIVPDLPWTIIDQFEDLEFKGDPNILSKSHVPWDIIYESSDAIKKPKTPPDKYLYIEDVKENEESMPQVKAAEIIRKRRSAQNYDPANSDIDLDTFTSILEKTLHYRNRAPFDVGVNEIYIDLAIFVHRVKGLEPGLYFFIRNEKHLKDLKKSCSDEFLWEQVKAGFPLYKLIEFDARAKASEVSCTQAIAGDSSFSLGMISLFDPIIKEAPYKYKNLFWESGVIGQVLYLEAEARGLRGTGIGCFFDDAMHDLLRLNTGKYQSLYHFTIGSPIDDERLTTLEPYYHFKDIRK